MTQNLPLYGMENLGSIAYMHDDENVARTSSSMRNFAEGTSTMQYHLPMPSLASKTRVHAYAEELRKKVKLKNGFQLEDLVNRNNGEITYIDFMDDDQTDAIIIEPDGKFLIRLSAHTGALRDNFTIAHELGHRLLHWPKVKKAHPGDGMKANRRVDASDPKALIRCEWEANWFASAFLMPSSEFRVAYRDGTASEVFGVTEAAVKVRATSLGLA